MLIGVHGRKGSGKDTVYERIAARLGGDAPVERRAFADPMYELAAASLGIPVNLLRRLRRDPDATVEVYAGKVEAFQRLSVRRYIQNFAQAHRAAFGEDFWVKQMDFDHERKIVVITDVRPANEAQAVIDAGGHILRVIGPPEVEDDPDDHVTEALLPSGLIDFTVLNHRRNDGHQMLDWQVLGYVLRLLREEKGRL